MDDLGHISQKNSARSLKKGAAWKIHSGPRYTGPKLPLFNNKKQVEQQASMPFLLPHEIVRTFFELGDPAAILGKSALQEDMQLLEKHALACEPPKDPAGILPLGLWSDGVPCKYDRSQSLEVIALSFPSLPGIRIPLLYVKKCFLVKQATMDAAFSVLSWSFGQLATGHHASNRHDGKAYLQPADRDFSGNASGPNFALCSLDTDKGRLENDERCFGVAWS